MTSLINEIDALQRELLLVLDDYHLIDNASIHETVGFLIEHLPAHMCLVIATRTDPPLAIHRYRARGQMIEIRVQDLRFNSEETRGLLQGILHTSFSAGDIAALESRVEGWAAGLQMVALSIQGRQDVHEFIENFRGSHRYIMDYLTEEIYNQQPPAIQRFLLQTSILERLSGPLCNAVLGAGLPAQGEEEVLLSAQQMLEYLERANLFLLPMDDERTWYRYHHLFASLLRQRLRQILPEEIEVLQRRASGWFAANGFFEEAFQYALAANDFQAAAQIVESQAMDLLKLGSLSTLKGWFDKLPPEIITARPRLIVDSAWANLLIGKLENIQGDLAAAEKNLDILDDPDELRGQIAAIRAYTAGLLGELDQAIDQAHLAFELLAKDDLTVRCVVTFVVGGIYYLRQDIPRALAAMKEASQLGEQAGNIHVAVSALNSIGDILKQQGNLDESERAYEQALQLGTGRSGQPLPITAGVYSGLAEIQLTRRDFSNARKLALIGLELGETWGNPDNQVSCYITLAKLEHLEGNLDGARAALEKAKYLAATYNLTPGLGEDLAARETAIFAAPEGRVNQGLLIAPLSERELEVLRLFAEGLSNQDVAEKLFISLGTVKAHSSNIYRKLDVRNRTQAVITAREMGLL